MQERNQMMKTNSKTSFAFVASLLAVFALGLSACTHFHPSGRISQTVDVTIHEAEMHDGFVRFVGTKGQPDGSRLAGSFDLSLSAVDGALKAEIVAVDMPGVDLNDRCIVEANHEMEEEFTHMAGDMDGEVQFQEVVVEEGALRMKIKVDVEY
jgi:hypothetical protein